MLPGDLVERLCRRTDTGKTRPQIAGVRRRQRDGVPVLAPSRMSRSDADRILVSDNEEMTEKVEAVRTLHRALLESWNARDPIGFSGKFAEGGVSVGFDGSTVSGQEQIQAHLQEIFGQHQTAAYVAKVREVRFLSAEAAPLRAVVGMVPPGQTDINPEVNAVQVLVAVKEEGEWRVALLQNTPAALYGRPDLSDQLTNELRRQ